jgi:hypothetical protein
VADKSPAHKQVRLLLEAQCARALNALVKKFHPKCDITLIVFDYSETEAELEFANVAYKTSLHRASLIELLEQRLLRWADPKPPTFQYDPRRHGWLPTEHELPKFGRFLLDQLPPKVGYCLLFGRGQFVQYLAAAERDGVAKMFENDLLPGLRADVLAAGGAL